MKLLLCSLLAILFSSSSAFALFSVEDETYDQKIHRLDTQERLSFWDVFTQVPNTFVNATSQAGLKDERGKWVLVGALTIPALYYDQDLFLQTQKFGRMWGLSNTDNLKRYGAIGDNFTIMWGPSDLSSGLYFLGDGWPHISTAVALLGYGALGDHTRSFNTGIEMLNGFLCSTIFEQVLKRAFGREDPGVQTYPGGAWRPFPGNSDYDKEKTRHDAFPSGHVMTTTVSFTVLRGNFPEYDHILFPVQLVYTAALGFGMTNNGNHWVGDYPLGVALGYFFGRAALKMSHASASSTSGGKTASVAKPMQTAWNEPSLIPSFSVLTGDPTTNLRWDF